MKKSAILCISIILLLSGVKTSRGDSQNAFVPDNFNGFFRQETYGSEKQKANSPISASLVFQEGENGFKYAVYAPYFISPSFQREYAIQGIPVKKFLPEKAKDDDYRRIIQSAWPDLTSGDMKQAVKAVKDWVKKNTDMPLLLITLLRRDNPVKVDGHGRTPKLIKHVSLEKESI